jgi:hypothetical protein
MLKWHYSMCNLFYNGIRVTPFKIMVKWQSPVFIMAEFQFFLQRVLPSFYHLNLL